MSQKFQPVRGTYDLTFDQYERHTQLVRKVESIVRRYSFSGIITPIFEHTSVFTKPLGDTSDIVGKEMYTFTDKGGESITLRPEGTAAAIRAIISEGLTQQLPLKLFYYGPMFRYERPQAGRFRQHYQFGVECIGVESPLADVEVLHLASLVFKELGISDTITLELNTLGDAESRKAYREALVAYLSQYQNELSEDSQRRLLTNPLRILDSKNEGDKKITANAPKLSQYLNDVSKTYFEKVCSGLESLGITYTLNDHLVRGLDYYNHTTFEFTTNAIGAQGTVLAGGRYNGLVANMGGPDLPGIGWAFGVERMLSLTNFEVQHTHPLAVMPFDTSFERDAFILTQQLREKGYTVDMVFSGNAGKRMKRADKVGAAIAIILAGDEMARGEYLLRNLITGEQQTVGHSDLLRHIQQSEIHKQQ